MVGKRENRQRLATALALAEVTLVGGIVIIFNPDKISSVDIEPPIANPFAPIPANNATAIFGLTKAQIFTNEPPEAFLGRLNLTAKFVKLTMPNGGPIWIKASAVATLRAPLPNESLPSVHCAIGVGDSERYVQENVAEVKAKLTAVGTIV